MTTTPSDNPLQEAFDLYKVMDDDLAVAHGNAEYNGTTIDDGWDQLPAQVSSAKAQLGQITDPGGSRKERRAESRHIRAVDEALGELHGALVDRANAQANYLTVEAGVKKDMAAGGSGDMIGLDQAREKLQRAEQTLQTSRMVYLTDLENLATDLGLWTG